MTGLEREGQEGFITQRERERERERGGHLFGRCRLPLPPLPLLQTLLMAVQGSLDTQRLEAIPLGHRPRCPDSTQRFPRHPRTTSNSSSSSCRGSSSRLANPGTAGLHMVLAAWFSPRSSRHISLSGCFHGFPSECLSCGRKGSSCTARLFVFSHLVSFARRILTPCFFGISRFRASNHR